jgi:hypothetical protein
MSSQYRPPLTAKTIRVALLAAGTACAGAPVTGRCRIPSAAVTANWLRWRPIRQLSPLSQLRQPPGGATAVLRSHSPKASRSAPGKRALNKAAQQRIQEQVVNRLVNCGKIDGIIVTGHADRLGLRKHKEEIAVKRAGMVARFRRAKCCCSDSNHGDHHQRASWATQGNFATRKLADYLSPNRRMVIHVQGHEK